MSEEVTIRVNISTSRLPISAIERLKIMGNEVSRQLTDIRKTVARVLNLEKTLSSTVGKFTDRVKIPRSRREDIPTHNLIPLDVKPIPIPKPVQRKAKAVNLDKVEKFMAMAKAIELPQLSSFKAEVKREMPELGKNVERAECLLKKAHGKDTGFKAKEITRCYEKLLRIIRRMDSEMQRKENLMTSEILKEVFGETGFGRISQVEKKDSSVVIRAGDEKSFTSIFAEIDARKGTKLDTQGFKEDSCKKVVDLVISKLEEKGVNVHIKKRVFHGSAKGGETAKKFETLFNPLAAPENKEVKKKREAEHERKKRFRLLRSRRVD